MRILAVSDIHIDDYPHKNPTEKARLLQTRTVAKNIIEVAKRNGCTHIVFAGDITERYLIRPYIQAEVKLFLETIMSEFQEGYIIWGNHDQDNKGNLTEFTDSCLSVMLPKNLYYADQKQIEVNGNQIGFLSWRPDLDLSWVNGKLDVLFTHATISYNDNDRYESQYLDESKFDLAICGDIHSRKQKGKYVSIGIPQKCKMGDSDESSGVVVDLTTKGPKWEWVNLNPHDNLIKLEYTNIKDEEGWESSTNTWKTYKPITNLSNNDGQNSSSMGNKTWENIEGLINGAIEHYGVQKVHSEVLKTVGDVNSKEVDFSFSIRRLYCRNWRSITEAELFFGDYDKVKIVGANGSGKSSILSALKYAFLKNTDYKSLIQFGAPDCRVEVDFTYQGIDYTIIRGSGTKNYGLIVSGNPVKYNGKKGFEEDLKMRFPFIDYIQDVMFLDSDHPRFIGSITPERKSEIISRFYKIDKIDSYNEQAQKLVESKLKEEISWKTELSKAEEVMNYIESRISLVVLPKLTEGQLRHKQEEGKNIQARWERYVKYRESLGDLTTKIELYNTRISEVRNELSGMRPENVIQGEIKETAHKRSWIQEKTSELHSIKREGRDVYGKRKDLDTAKTCTLCGHVIEQHNLDSHKAELDQKINDLIQKQNDVYNELLLQLGIDKAAADSGCKDIISELTRQEAALISEMNHLNKLSSDLYRYEELLRKANEEKRNIGPEPEYVELPTGFVEAMGKIEADLSTWNQWNGLVRDKEQGALRIDECRNALDNLSQNIKDYASYIKLTGPTGKIYEEILKSFAEQFTDNRVEYTVEVTTGRKDHLNLMSSYRIGDNTVSYQNCSDGQKTFLDIDFMSKVLTKVGFLVFDEALKYLDSKRLEEVIEIIGQMDVGLILLSSHVESLSNFNNRTLNVELDENGNSKIQIH